MMCTAQVCMYVCTYTTNECYLNGIHDCLFAFCCSLCGTGWYCLCCTLCETKWHLVPLQWTFAALWCSVNTGSSLVMSFFCYDFLLFLRVLYLPSLGYCLLVTVGLKKIWTWCNSKVGPVLLYCVYCNVLYCPVTLFNSLVNRTACTYCV